MKKFMFVMVLVMAALVVNAQRTPVKVTDLQKSITENITKNYPGFIIKDAAKVVENSVAKYEVAITKGTTAETLVFDKDGKFLNKLAMKIEKPAKSGNAHIAHKAVQKKS
jgi:hypothetical protein